MLLEFDFHVNFYLLFSAVPTCFETVVVRTANVSVVTNDSIVREVSSGGFEGIKYLQI